MFAKKEDEKTVTKAIEAKIHSSADEMLKAFDNAQLKSKASEAEKEKHVDEMTKTTALRNIALSLKSISNDVKFLVIAILIFMGILVGKMVAHQQLLDLGITGLIALMMSRLVYILPKESLDMIRDSLIGKRR